MEKRCVKSGRNITAGLVVGCVAFNSTCLLCTEDEQEVEEELEEEVGGSTASADVGLHAAVEETT